ncbi:MAG: MlaD family protein [Candidatus Lernaella stagnicola]|nr:MlaD family protein [Candidatus Lernaella stagnicola]
MVGESKTRSRWFLIAAFVLILSAACAGCDGNLFAPKPAVVYVSFDDLDGLQQEAVVFFEGRQVGKVAAIQGLANGGARVTLSIPATQAAGICANPVVAIKKPGFLAGNEAKPEVHMMCRYASGKALATGQSLHGVSWFRYRVVSTSRSVKDGLTDLVEEVDQLTDDLDEFVASKDFEYVLDSVAVATRKIEMATVEQKEKLAKQTLPKLERQIEAARQHYEKLGEVKKARELDHALEALRQKSAP